MNSSPSPQSTAPVELSIIIPVFNEEKNIGPLLDRIKLNVDKTGLTYEIIFIDDGSRDGTWPQISKYAGEDKKIKGISLSRNFGHQHAILAGCTFSKGQAIISLDGDLQHPPELIPDMIKEWKKGYKIINTHRISHAKMSLFKKMGVDCRYYFIFIWNSFYSFRMYRTLYQ